jgi:proteic killer suppression protein
MAIQSFRHKGLERFFLTGSRAGIDPAHARKLAGLLAQLEVVSDVRAMAVAGYGLHALGGRDSGRFSIRVNGNWRLTFAFEAGHALLVDYEDYH